MSKWDKIIKKIFSENYKNIRFFDIVELLKKLGFECRIKGDHFIFVKPNIEEIINIQPDSQNMAKIYQLKQIRKILFSR